MTEIEHREDEESPNESIIKEIIALERRHFFEKGNSKTERQRKIREIIEKHTKTGANEDDS